MQPTEEVSGMGEHEPRNFLQPCLLLLLSERSDYGYDLVDRLRALHGVDGDAGVVYRALHALEKAGMVLSSWEPSETGPARRTYRVTDQGRGALHRQAVQLEHTHQVLHLFGERYRLTCVDAPARRIGHGGTHSGPGRHDDRPAHGTGERAGR